MSTCIKKSRSAGCVPSLRWISYLHHSRFPGLSFGHTSSAGTCILAATLNPASTGAMSEQGLTVHAGVPPPKPAKPSKPPKPAPSACPVTPSDTRSPQGSPSIAPNRPPPPPGPPPQPGQASCTSQATTPPPPPPPPQNIPRAVSPLPASRVVNARTSSSSPVPLTQERRDFANPLRKSSIADGKESPTPPVGSPKIAISLKGSTTSTSSSYSNSPSGSSFRPDSVMTQVSSITMQDQDEEAAAGLYPLFENAIKQNVLSKMNRDGKFEKQLFVLTPDELIYCHLPTIKPNSVAANAMASLTGTSESTAATPVAPPPARKLPLCTLMALPLAVDDRPGKEDKRARTFKIISKQKSFFMRAPTVEAKDEWMQAIQEAVSELQQGSTPSPVRTVADSAPIYVSSESSCQICTKVFTFFVRKNHCHNCGKCICEICSKDKMRVPKIDEKRLFRVCNPCGKELKSMRVYGVQHRDEDD